MKTNNFIKVILIFLIFLSSCLAKKGSTLYYEEKVEELDEYVYQFTNLEIAISQPSAFLNRLEDESNPILKEKIKRALEDSMGAKKEMSSLFNKMVLIRKELPDSIFYKLKNNSLSIIAWADKDIQKYNANIAATRPHLKPETIIPVSKLYGITAIDYNSDGIIQKNEIQHVDSVKIVNVVTGCGNEVLKVK